MTPGFHRRRRLYPTEMRTGRRTSPQQRSRARNLDISSQAVGRETSRSRYKPSPADSRQQESNRNLAITRKRQCITAATRVNGVVKRFFVHLRVGVRRDKVRLPHDNVNRGWATEGSALRRMRTYGG